MKHFFHIILFLIIITSKISVIGQDEYTIELLPFNTRQFDEFSPVLYNGQLIFCSDKKTDVFVTFTTPEGKSLFNLYSVTRQSDNKWSEPRFFSSEINTHFHEGPVAFEPGFEHIYFTRNNNIEGKLGNSLSEKEKMGIYTARNINGQWQNIRSFKYSRNQFNYMHPAVSPDGSFMVFASDEDGGYGGFDLYICYDRNGRWMDKENLGPNVNTERDEVFPYVHSSGRLYFSSDGHDGFGRLDIFYSYDVEGTWTTPVNAGEPFNSRFDDFGVSISDDFESGYFTSSRKRSDDIYQFKMLLPSFESCKEIEENSYCYAFYEKGSMDLDTTSLKYEWDLGDGTKIRNLSVEHCYDSTGRYIVQLNVIDTLTGETYFNEASYILDVEDIEQVYITSRDTVLVDEEVILDGLETNLKNFEIDRYYWRFGDGSIATGASVSHIYKKPGSYTVQLGVVDIPDEENGQEKKACGVKTITVLME